MTGHIQEDAKNTLSKAYQDNNTTLEQRLKSRGELLNGKPFMKLNEEKQLQYCRLNKEIMEGYWKNFEFAKADKNYSIAARAFQNALIIGFSKAIDSYNENPETNSALKRKLRLHSRTARNFTTGVRYRLGLGLPQNREQAVRFFQAAASKGHADAQFNLGYAYYIGKGVEKDKKEAVRWFRMATKQGHATAQFNLGHAYYIGKGVEKEKKEAVRWFRMAAEQGHAGALESLKKIDTPLAQYTIALLEKNHTNAITLALEHQELHDNFFKQDIVGVVNTMDNKGSMDALLDVLQEKAQKLNKNINSSLINALLSIDLATRTNEVEHSEAIVHLKTQLINLAHIANAEQRQVKPLIQLLCYLHDEVESPENLMKPLMILWHRAQALEVPMDDSGLNRLIAARIVNHLFENTYCLKLTPEFKEDDLATLVFAYGRKSPLTVEQLNAQLSEPLLIDSKYNPKQVMPRLSACLSKDSIWKEGIPVSIKEIARLINEQPQGTLLDDKTTEKLLLQLQEIAAPILRTSKLRGLFKAELEPEEKKLLQCIETADTLTILEWIETREAPFEQEDNTVLPHMDKT